MFNNAINKEEFENDEEYIKALKQANPFHLERRQLQDLANHEMSLAAKNEDWEKALAAHRYQDLAINLAASRGESATQTLVAAINVMASDEEQAEIDKRLEKMEEKSRKEAQNIADRINAREEQKEDEENGEEE